ncbi:MAG: organic solvent tolerance protein OstA [Pirellulaceae bacterium]
MCLTLILLSPLVAIGQDAIAPPPPLGAPLPLGAPPSVAPTGVPLAVPGPFTGLAGLGAPRSIKILPRSSVRLQSPSFPSPDGREQITIIDSGVRILIEYARPEETIDIATDRLVIWTPSPSVFGDGVSMASLPVEFYMEGNIVFRQGERFIHAQSMYYNVQQQRGVVLQAELFTPVPNVIQGVARLKADVLQQVDRYRYTASGAALTTSRLGVPRYWIQSDEMSFEDIPYDQVDPTSGQLVADPTSGQLLQGHRYLATSRGNSVFVGGVPIFSWPSIRTDLTKPSFYLNNINVGNDRVFGTQISTDWDLKQLLGLGGVSNWDWSGSLDYLSERGVGFGSQLEYHTDRVLQLPGPTDGFFDAWGINDNGLDFLGRTRRDLIPEKDFRGRVFWQHRQRFLNGIQFTGELGYISDRNFLEQFYELEWDQWKDQTTGLELKQLVGNGSWSVVVDGQVNDFFTQTEWLPRADHFLLGRSLLGDRLTWYEHSQVGYGILNAATAPMDATDLATFNPLPWEADREGIRAVTRQELDVPFELGALKVVPYLLGELAHWGDDLNGNDLSRAYGQAGVRASLPMWSVDRSIQNTLLNLNGLAHKVVFDVDFFWADASQNFDQLPLYDPLDDDSIEAFRRRIADSTFGGALNVADPIPLRFDERYYALRTGMQSWVTAPSAEIADDLMVLKFGARQRWQTKRGAYGRERIVDVVTLDMGASLFPNANENNFGEDIGLINYDLRWHVGDRLTLASDGLADTFSDGLRMFTFGGYVSRPERGSAYVGFRTIEGPISSNVLLSSYHYRLGPKWILTVGNAYDFSKTGDIGHTLEVTRVGESFLVSMGLNVDQGRNNVGFIFAIEPRFLTSSRRGQLGGVQLAPASARGLE